MACLDERGAVVAAVGRLCQQPTMPIDDMRSDIDANRLVQCPTEPHKNQTVSLVASSPKTIRELLETSVCNENRHTKKLIREFDSERYK